MNIATVGSIAPGICVCVPTPPGPYPDIGVVMSGSVTYFENGQPVATIGSLVMYSCGASVIMSGAGLEFETGLPVAKTGSSVVGCGNGVLIGNGILNISM
jgi:uncharacterized Zn-binding protein involved in type VI secretion